MTRFPFIHVQPVLSVVSQRRFQSGWRFLLPSVVCLVPVIASSGLCQAQWADVAPGISYREFSLDGPVRVFAARMDRSMDHWMLDTMTSLGTVKGGYETVPNMVARYNDSITPKGDRYEIKVAINGDYFNLRTGYATGGQVISGWYALRFGEYSGGSGIIWTWDRRCLLGGNVRNDRKLQKLYMPDKSTVLIDKLNGLRGDNELAVYTWQYADNTGNSNDGIEVLLCMEEPADGLSPNGRARGKVVQVRRNAGATPLPYDHVVLSGNGKASEPLTRVQVGDTIGIELGLTDYGNEDIGLAPADWRQAYASLGGPCCVLVNGKVPRHWEAKAAKLAKEGKKHGSVVKDPRTAIAFDKKYVYFLVIDGRSKESIGMTFTEAGQFCKDRLEATDAILQDGGGSSTLWVDGKVKNTPSGKISTGERHGALRAVANGVFIAIVHPRQQSDKFTSPSKVQVVGNVEARLGPGSQFGLAGKVSAGQAGDVIPQRLNGVLAKGIHWWQCQFGETQGWIPEDKLAGNDRR